LRRQTVPKRPTQLDSDGTPYLRNCVANRKTGRYGCRSETERRRQKGTCLRKTQARGLRKARQKMSLSSRTRPLRCLRLVSASRVCQFNRTARTGLRTHPAPPKGGERNALPRHMRLLRRPRRADFRVLPRKPAYAIMCESFVTARGCQIQYSHSRFPIFHGPVQARNVTARRGGGQRKAPAQRHERFLQLGSLCMQFHVLAIRDDGSTHLLMVDATDAAAVRRILAEDRMTPLELRPVGSRTQRLRSILTARTGPSRTSRFDVDLFCQELLALVTAGVPVGEALETLASKDRHASATSSYAISATSPGAPAAGGSLIQHLHARVREGLPLSAALAQHPTIFPGVLCESLRAAERTSDYGPALERFVRYRRLTREVREKLVAASIYPMILLGVSTLVLLFLMGYVVPRFASVYADMGDKLPAASRALLWLGSCIGAQPWLTSLLLAAFVAALVAALRSSAFRSAFVRVLQHIPRVRDVLAAAEFSRLYRTLALLVYGGIPMVDALQLARGLLPMHLARRLDAGRQSISEGRAFSASMQEYGLSTAVADRFFRVGEGSGKLAEMMDRAADFHEEEVARGADWLGRIIGPFLMLVMGVVIGLVVVLMYMPIFSLAEAIQ